MGFVCIKAKPFKMVQSAQGIDRASLTKSEG